MSMILDALSRAEKERQADNNIDLDATRYVASSTIKEDRFKRWVLLALVANFVLIVVIAGAYVWKNYFITEPVVVEVNQRQQEQAAAVVSEPAESIDVTNAQPNLALVVEQPQAAAVNLIDSSNKTSSVSSLVDEAQVQKSKPIISKTKKVIAKKAVKKTPPVQYSSQPLTQIPSNNQPTVASIAQAVERERLGEYTKLSDMPVAQRSQLSQYEVNVHVYDDNPQSRFVLINMVKYKEGDRLSGGSASVSSIVPEGVVVNYGNQQVLIERNK